MMFQAMTPFYLLFALSLVGAVKLDFSGFSAGDWVSHVGLNTTVTATSNAGAACFGPNGNEPMIFDSGNPSDDDRDIGSPNKDFGGPGRGQGGKRGKHGENAVPLGNLIIMSSDCNTDIPNDSAEGGVFTFSFDEPKHIKSLGVLDFEKGLVVELSRAKRDGTPASKSRDKIFEFKGVGNNGFMEALIDVARVLEMRVITSGSGGIAHVEFSESTLAPTNGPALAPSNGPTLAPSNGLALAPSNGPTLAPSNGPTLAPSNGPTLAPSNGPTLAPSNGPTLAPSNGPTLAPTNGPTLAPTEATDPCNPSPCGTNAICLAEQDTFDCFCDSGFSGDPLVACNGLPDVSVTGIAPNSFNAESSSLCFAIVNDNFNTDIATLEVLLNGATVPQEQLGISSSEICLVGVPLSTTMANECSISAQAALSGATLSASESFWAGSGTATISLVDKNGVQVQQEVTITARLADDTLVQEEQIGTGGVFVFDNLPYRSVIFDAVAADGSSGAFGLVGEGSATITLVPFGEPSDIENNDFSLGTEGWNLENAGAVAIVDHLENAGPAFSGVRRRTQADLVDKDFKLSTQPIEGPTSTSRTFETKEGTTGVRIRYRFETSEYPVYYQTEFNDFYKVSIRSQTVGGSKTDVTAMNDLLPSDFGPGSVYPSTAWQELVLPVSANGDTIQVDVTVANVGDGLFQSHVYIDFVEELTQGLCIYSLPEPDASLIDGHAAIVYYSQNEEGIELTTYGLWPDDHEAVPDNGDGTDIRTNLFLDAVSGYNYFYCEPISEEQKVTLDGLVGANVKWTCTNSCASFASETFHDVTGTDVDADDFLGIETPREISESILALNGGSPLPKEGLPWQGSRRLRNLVESSLVSFPSLFLSECDYI